MSMDTSDRLDPWFDDGNIVLSAERKFSRVHRSILSSYSEVFRDMFACPHSDTVETELVEGCPIVRVHDAATTDIQVILKAMYSRNYMVSCHDQMPFRVVSAFLRLGRKYDIPQLFSEAEARIRPHIESKLSAVSGIKGVTVAPGPISVKGLPRMIQLMNLLCESDLTAYLPLIMFQCTLCSPVDPLVNGHELEDGSVCSLSVSNLKSYIRMKDTLNKFRVQLNNASVIVNAGRTRSCSSVGCASSLFDLCSDSGLTDLQPFCPWSKHWDDRFCWSCRASLKPMRDAAIKEAWEALPTTFGFGSWEMCTVLNVPSLLSGYLCSLFGSALCDHIEGNVII